MRARGDKSLVTKLSDIHPCDVRPYFTFPPINLAVELKLCNRPEREKEIIAEINDDIVAFKTKYRNLVFAVYDLGFIRDMDRFSQAFEASEGVIVRVVKH